MDWRGVDQCLDAAAVGDLHDDLFKAYGLAGTERLGQGEFVEGDLAAVGAPEGYQIEEFLQRAAGHLQAADDPSGLLVQRHRDTGFYVEYHHTDRRGVDQGFQIVPGPLFVAVAAGVGDNECGLACEHDQGLFIFRGECLASFCHGEKDVADAFSSVEDGRGQEGERNSRAPGQGWFGKVEGPDVADEVGKAERVRDITEVFEEFQGIGQIPQGLGILGSQAGGEKVSGLARFIKEGEYAVAGTGERAGGVEDALQDGVKFEALVDTQAGPAQPGKTVAQRFILLYELVGGLHFVSLPDMTVRRWIRVLNWAAMTQMIPHSTIWRKTDTILIQKKQMFTYE